MSWLDKLTQEQKEHLKYAANETTLKGCKKQNAIDILEYTIGYQVNTLHDRPCSECQAILNVLKGK